MIRKRNARGGFVDISGGYDEVRYQPGFDKGARVEMPRCVGAAASGAQKVQTTSAQLLKCKIDRDNQKPRTAVRDAASTGRSRVANEVELSALLYVLGTGEWLVFRLLS